MNLKLNIPRSQKKNEWFNAINVFVEDSAVLGVLSLTGGEDFDALRAGGFVQKQIETSIANYYEGEKDYSIFLRKTVKDAKDRLLRLIEFDEDIKSELIDLSLVLIFVKENILYIAKLQGTGVYIKRGNELINLSNRLEDPKGLNQIFVGSGLLEEGDLVLISTKYSSETELESEFRQVFKDNLVDKSMLCLGYNPNSVDEKNLYTNIEKAEEKENYLEDHDSSKLEAEEKLETQAINDAEVNREEKASDLIDAHDNIDYHEQESNQDETVSDNDSKLKQIFSDIKFQIINIAFLIKFKAQNLLARFKKDKVNDSQIGIDSQNEPEVTSHQIVNNKNDKTYVHILQKIKTFVLDIINKIKLKISDYKNSRPRKIHLKGGPRSFPIKRVVAVVLVFALLIFITNKKISEKREEDKRQEEYASYVSSAEENISKAEEIAQINKTRAKAYLSDSLTDLEKAKEYGIDTSKIDEKESSVLGLMDEIDGIIPVEGLEILFDSINSFESDGIVDFTINGGNTYVLDQKKGNVYVVELDSGKSAKLLNDGDLNKPLNIESLSDDKLAVYDEDEGLILVNITAKTASKLAGLSPTTVGIVKEIENYYADKNDILYSLRPEKSRIDKLTRLGDSFSSPQLRLEDADIANGVDMAIDGNIFVLTNSGSGILRYFTGKRVDTKLSKEDIDPSGFKAFDTNATVLSIYILDSKNKQIIRAAKPTQDMPNTMQVLEQLVYRGDKNLFANFKEILVNSDETKMFVLDGSRLLSIPIK